MGGQERAEPEQLFSDREAIAFKGDNYVISYRNKHLPCLF